MPGCQKECELSSRANCVNVSSRGSDNPTILEVGEAPGRDEDSSGTCFVGPAGQRLDEYNYKAAITEVVRLTNVVRCCPWEMTERKKKIGKPSKKQIDHCAEQHLIPEIIQCRPKLIVPLGDKAWSFFGKGKISTVQGSFRAYTILAEDYPHLLKEDLTIPLLPTFHPSYALRGNVMADKAIMEDLTKARHFISGLDQRTETYTLYTDLDAIDALADWIVEQYRAGGFKYPCIACDLETEGLKPRDPEKNIVGIGFSWEIGTGVYIPFNGNKSPWKNNHGALIRIRNAVKRILDVVPVVGQNFEFDRRWLWYHLGIQAKLYFDTMLAHKWLYQDTRPHNLEYMTGAYTDLMMHKAEAQVAGAYDGENMTEIDLGIIARLCGGDCDATLRVMEHLKGLIEEGRGSLPEFHVWNMEPAQEMFGLEAAGAHMDLTYNAELRKYFRKRMATVAESMRSVKLNGVVLNEEFIRTYNDADAKKPQDILLSSAKRMKHLLYSVLRLKPPKDGSTGETALKVIMRSLDSSFPDPKEWDGQNPPPENMEWYLVCKMTMEAILDYRSAQKQVGTYVNAFENLMLSDGCVHPEYHICSTVTGRSSVSEPPLQTLPRKEGGKFKRVFISRFKNGLLYNGDESQVEVRCLAYYSQDPKMMELFETGDDMHRLVASRFFGKAPQDVTKEERTMIKSVVFGMFYGRSDEAVSEATGLPVNMVSGIVEAFWGMFSVAARWREETVWYAKQYGGVYGAQKRWRFLPHINNMNDRKLMGEAERQAVNTPIQGLASDFAQHGIVRTMRRMRREKFASIPFQFVHDSFGVDVYPGDLFDTIRVCDDEFVRRAHQLFPWWNIPFKFEHEIGLNLKDTVEVSYHDGMIESEALDTPDVLNDIASVVSKWYNSEHVQVDEDGEGKHRLTITLGQRRPMDKGDQWLEWSDDEFRKPALQPFYTQWQELWEPTNKEVEKP